MSQDKRPNPSWSAEKMAEYMKEKYGDKRFVDRNGRPVSWKELCKILDNKPVKDK